MCGYVCVFVCAVLLNFSTFHSSGVRTHKLCSNPNIHNVFIEELMSLQPFILCGRSALMKKFSLEKPKAIHKHGITEKGKVSIGIDALIWSVG